jgi:Na+/proline symporter
LASVDEIWGGSFTITSNITQNETTSFEILKKTYPRLAVSIILIIILGLLVPLSGIIICIVKCYTFKKSQSGKHDKKSHRKKRTIYSVVLAFLLFVLFISTVILFTSNQNAYRSMKVMSSDLETNLERAFNFKMEKLNELKIKMKTKLPEIEAELLKITDANFDDLKSIYFELIFMFKQ